MKKTLIILSSVIMMACSKPQTHKPTTKILVWTVEVDSTSTNNSVDLSRIQILTIDSCEYVYTPIGNTPTMVHKGNCKNCSKHKS